MAEQQQERSEDLEVLVNTPEVLLFEGKEYKVYPLDLMAMTLLRRWAKSRIVSETRENIKLLGDDIPPEMIGRIWDSTYGQLRDPMISDAMECPEAIIYWLFLSIKSGDDSITEEIVNRYAKSRNVQDILDLLVKLNGMDKGKVGNEGMAQVLMERRKQIGLKSS